MTTATASAAPDRTVATPVLDAPRLEGLVVAFGLLGRLFWEDPHTGMAADLAFVRDLLRREPFSSAAPEAATRLEGALAAYEADPLAEGQLLRQDRTRLFYQVGRGGVSPYESVYRTPDHTMFGPSTAQVKTAYARHGLRFEPVGNEPCDHFALECMYVARLARAGVQASLTGDDLAVRGACAETARFLDAHLLTFGPTYLREFTRQASTDFYRAAGELAQGVLAWAAGLLGCGRGGAF